MAQEQKDQFEKYSTEETKSVIESIKTSIIKANDRRRVLANDEAQASRIVSNLRTGIKQQEKTIKAMLNALKEISTDTDVDTFKRDNNLAYIR